MHKNAQPPPRRVRVLTIGAVLSPAEEEMANMISSSRSFQVNVEVLNTAKSLAERVLTLGQ